MNESTLLSIKEFSRFTGIKQSTLRYYDSIGLLTPTARGENNYRYYQPYQIIKLNYINVLADLGVPLSVIRDMDAGRSPEKILELLREQELDLDRRLNEIRTDYLIIHSYSNYIRDALKPRGGDVGVEELPEARYVLGGMNDFSGAETFYSEFIRFCHSADERRINLKYPVGGYHESPDGFMKTPGRPDRFFSLDPTGNRVRPRGDYLVGYNKGYYGELGGLPGKIAAYAREHGLALKGHVYEEYLLDEVSVAEPSQYLQRIAIAI